MTLRMASRSHLRSEEMTAKAISSEAPCRMSLDLDGGSQVQDNLLVVTGGELVG